MLSQDVRPSICLSVCLSHAGILSKRLNISSDFFGTKRYDNVPTGSSLTGTSNAGGMKNRDSWPISLLSRK